MEFMGLIVLNNLFDFFRRFLRGGKGVLLLFVSKALIIDELIGLIVRLIGSWLGIKVFLRIEVIFLTEKEIDLVFIILCILIIDVKKGVLQLFLELGEKYLFIL